MPRAGVSHEGPTEGTVIKLASCLVAAKIGRCDRTSNVVQGTPVPAGDHRALRVGCITGSPPSFREVGGVDAATRGVVGTRSMWWAARTRTRQPGARSGAARDAVIDAATVAGVVARDDTDHRAGTRSQPGPAPLFPVRQGPRQPPASAPPYATLRGMYFTVKWTARVDGPGPQPGVPQWDEDSLVIGGTH